MKKICITGINGFIGNPLFQALSKINKPVTGTVRSKDLFLRFPGAKVISIGDINLNTNWKNALVDTDCVIHCAGRAHIINETKINTLKIYRSVNVDGSKQLAKQAAEAGVKRLIFLSSVKVNGESTDNTCGDAGSNNKKKNMFTQNDKPDPKDPYAISKLEAEKVLWEVSNKTGLEVTVVRLPLVYGHGVKGNLAKLIKLVKSGIPLPLSMIQNQRSMIGVDNLIDLLTKCIDHPHAAGKTFLASDGEDLSTPDLISHISYAMGQSVRLFPVPIFLLKFFAHIFSKQKEIDRLVGSLRVNNSHTRQILNWIPPTSITEGIRRMIQGK